MKLPFPKAILLDLDDTILALSDGSGESWRLVCDEFACRVEPLTPAALLAAIDTYRNWFWSDAERHRRGRLDLDAARREIVAGTLLRLGTEDVALAEEIARAYSARREAGIQPFPGAIETLQRLRDRGARLGLLTNGHAEDQGRKIARWGLAPFFDCILIEGAFGVGKPDPRVYLHALDCLSASPSETWMAGDNLEWDVAAPQRLGIFGIWVDYAGTGLPEASPVRPDRIIRSLSELP